MKKLLLIALLLPMVVMGQKMTGGKEIPVKDEILKCMETGFTADALSGSLSPTDSAYSTSGLSPYYSINNKPLEYVFHAEAKPIMSVTAKDKDGNYKVWIDRKRIVWTSDSTFTLKTRE